MLKRKIPLLMAAVILSTALPAGAQSVTRLTETRVRDFYASQTDLFKKPYDQFIKTYDQRIHPDLLFTSRTTLILPDQPPMQTEPATLRKSDLVGNAQNAYDGAKGASLSTDITSIQIGPDGKSAAVTSQSKIRGMNFPTSDGSPMKADSVETCNDEVVLAEGGDVQILKSDCNAEVTILK